MSIINQDFCHNWNIWTWIWKKIVDQSMIIRIFILGITYYQYIESLCCLVVLRFNYILTNFKILSKRFFVCFLIMTQRICHCPERSGCIRFWYIWFSKIYLLGQKIFGIPDQYLSVIFSHFIWKLTCNLYSCCLGDTTKEEPPSLSAIFLPSWKG